MSGQKPKIANNIPQWADMIRQQLGVKGTDPDKNDKIWAADTAGWCFSSGSDLDEKDYLLLRVIWTHNQDINDLSAFVRNNPDLKGGEYTGYVSPENDALAKQIYERIKPEFEGYLEDIRSNKDGTRPRSSCGQVLDCQVLAGYGGREDQGVPQPARGGCIAKEGSEKGRSRHLLIPSRRHRLLG